MAKKIRYLFPKLFVTDAPKKPRAKAEIDKKRNGNWIYVPKLNSCQKKEEKDVVKNIENMKTAKKYFEVFDSFLKKNKYSKKTTTDMIPVS